MTNNDYILKSEFRKMIEKMETYIEQSVEHEWIDKSDLLSELDKIPTISPVEIIEQELNELKIAHPIAKRYGGDAQYISCIRILEKLLQKFKSLS